MDIGNLPDGGIVLDADQFVIARGGTARRIQGVRLVRTDTSGNALLSGDPIIAANRKLRVGNTPALGGDGGDTTFLYTGDDALIVRNAADSATLFRISSGGAGVLTGTLNVTGALSQAGNQVWHVGNFTPGNYVSKAGDTVNGGIVFNGDAQANARLIMNGGQFPAMTFQRSGVGAWYIGGIGAENNNFGVRLNANAPFLTIGSDGSVNATALLQQGGNPVWHAGNLSPNLYARLSGSTFSGDITAGGLNGAAGYTTVVGGGDAHSGFIGFHYPSGTRAGYIGFSSSNGGLIELRAESASGWQITGGVAITGALDVSSTIRQGGSPVWHSGNFNPGSYATTSALTSGLAGKQNTIGYVPYDGEANPKGFLTSSTPITAGQISSALGYTPYNGSANPSNFLTGISASQVNAALGYTPYNGSTNPNAYLTGITSGQVTTALGYVPLSSINSASVTNALGYTPYNGAANPNGYLSAITSGQVTGALGYTPYNGGTNPNGYLSAITSGLVTGALGYTPANRAGETFTGAFGRDANFTLDLVGGNPRVTFDSGDYLSFDRAANKLTMVIGGNAVASVDSGGTLRVSGNVIGATAP